jgi:undecaprenyl pyrophosphate phosphatase UppP
MNPNIKEIQDKVADYSRFGMVLLAVSVFMFIGVLIPNEGKEMLQLYSMMAATTVFLGAALYFFQKVNGYKKKLNEVDEEH